jgi:hypothetical protein
VGHLTTRVHPAVGTARYGERRLTRQGEATGKRLFQDLLDRPQARLTAPAMKA